MWLVATVMKRAYAVRARKNRGVVALFTIQPRNIGPNIDILANDSAIYRSILPRSGQTSVAQMFNHKNAARSAADPRQVRERADFVKHVTRFPFVRIAPALVL